MTCKCQVCEIYREFEKNIVGLTEEQTTFFTRLYENYVYTSEDLSYFKSIHEGKWPSGKIILERALERY